MLLDLLLGFAVSIPGLTVLLLLFAWWRARRRRQRLTALREFHCCLCHTPFDEAAVEYLGDLDAADLARLDLFQRRFAAYRVLCHECDAVNYVTKDGTPFKAMPRETG